MKNRLSLFKVFATAAALLSLGSGAMAASILINNFSFEANTGTPPTSWAVVGGTEAAQVWSGINSGGPAALGTNAVLASQRNDFFALTQTTSHVIAAGEQFDLTVAFGNRNSGITPYGGSWMRIAVTDGISSYIVANAYTSTGDPGLGLWADRTLSWTVPVNLALLPTISNGITGTTPDGFADISVGTWNINILVGANYPTLSNDPFQQTGIDNVRLDVVPEPSTATLLGLVGLGVLVLRRRA